MEDQKKLDIQEEKKLDTIEKFEFEPIKGYPMLHWKGKRPFNSTQFYPAQLKESYGAEEEGWMNKIFWGDNLQVMSHMLKQFRGKIKLIYIDPPYDSSADYKKKISVKGKAIKNDHNSFEEKQYTDIWTNDDYLQFMYQRLVLMRELLSEDGSIYVHIDFRKVHHIRCILDEIFGSENFINEVIWHYTSGGASNNKFSSKHDSILFYSKTSNYKFNTQKYKRYIDKSLGYNPNVEYFFDEEKQSEYTLNNMTDVWTDIGIISTNAFERVGYPTQKPQGLVERIIKASSNEGDIVFDCFMGSGTTQSVARKLGRKFIGSDINLGAVEITISRLIKDIQEDRIANAQTKLNILNDPELNDSIHYNGFSVLNVNNYDIFRNPLQAREILIQALEIQPLPNNSIYDGEKDGRMVKIMPVNRIATRADLNDLISGFNIKAFEKKFETSPNKAVESLLLVCMGHEPDLAAALQKEMHPYKLDVEVVDILRDKSNLEFKRDSEANVIIEKNKLIIKEFYPMNLLQKLSLMKENVEDWKELTESIKIDFNYDGSVFEPKVVDVPEKDNLVLGEYEIPEDAGSIRIKITDLLSESLELTIESK
jgi:site-specific DNA-methyltransferase (adenine-specific)